MSGRFLLRRSQAARKQAQRNVEASTESITTLVALLTALADRMEAMPSAGLERDRGRLVRVQALRRTAEAGTRILDARSRCRTDGQDGQHQAGM